MRSAQSLCFSSLFLFQVVNALEDYPLQESSFSIFSIILALCLGWLVFYVLNLFFKIRRQIAKGDKHVPTYWQIMVDGLFYLPLFSPYIFTGNVPIVRDLAEKYQQRLKDQGEEKVEYKQLAIRVVSPNDNGYLFWDKDSFKEILMTKSGAFDKPIELFYEPFNIFNRSSSSLLSAPDGEVWKNHHSIVSPSFSTSNLQFMCEVATKSTDLLFATKWDKEAKKNNGSFVMDPEDMSSLTLQIIGSAGFGLDFGIFTETSADEGLKFRQALTKVISQDFFIRFFLGNGWIRSVVSKYTGNEAALNMLSTKLDEFIGKRQREFTEDPEKPLNDLLSQLVKANMGSSSRHLDMDELKSNAYIFVVAGHETTSTSMQWLIYELSKHPDIQQKAREEAIKIGGGEDKLNPPTFDDYFTNMDYLHACLLEALRLHPPVQALVKRCCKTTKVGDCTVQKGSYVYLHDAVCHVLSPEFNNDKYKGDQFAPERFMDKEFKQKVQTSCSLIPFSMGNRKCIGFTFTQIETCMLLCRTLQFYEFKLLNDESVDPIVNKFGITCRPGNLKVLVTKRK